MLEVIFLSIVQGITEFLPVSSSAHLVLVSNFFNLENQNLKVDISLHTGSLLAIIFFYKNDFLNIRKNKDFYYKLIIATIPTLVVGYLLVKFNLIEYLRNYETIGWMTILFGFVLYFADKSKINKKIKTNFNFKSAIIIGMFQILSLIPGVSRSGITISAGRLLNYDREESAKISFLLSVPTLIAVTFFNIFSIYEINNFHFSKLNFFAIFLSFIFSFVTIKYFFKFIKEYNLNIFVFYRIVLGIIILFLI